MKDEALRAWLDGFSEMHESKSAGMLVELFASNAVFHVSPFQAPLSGLESLMRYFDDILGIRREGHFNSETIYVDGRAGWAHWTSSFTREGTDEPVRQEGIMKVLLDEAAKCTELRQWWHALEPVQADLMRDFDA